jgi:hypothetical protein
VAGQTVTVTVRNIPVGTTLTRQVRQVVRAGSSLSTDVEGNGATPTNPIEVSVGTPNTGTVAIAALTGNPPFTTPFSDLAQWVRILAPPATASDPLVITFRLDASILPRIRPGKHLEVFRDGVAVADCSGAASVASPNPCVSSRTSLADGDLRVRILTSHASAWTFAGPAFSPGVGAGTLHR